MSTSDADAMRQHGGLDALKASVFGLVHALAERTGHHRTTTVSQCFAVALFIFDWLQKLTLFIRPQFGFSAAAVDAARAVSVRGQTFGSSWTLTAATVAVVCGIVAVFSALLFDTRRRIMANSMRDGQVLRNLRVIRVITPLLVCALPTVVIDVLVAPLSCAEMQSTLGNDWQCFTGAHIVVCIACVACLALFLPVAVILKLLYHESDPNAAELMTMSSGTGAATDVVATALTCILALVGHRLATLAALLSTAAWLYTSGWTALHLPMFHHLMNPLLCSLQLLMAHAGVGACIGSAFFASDPLFGEVWLLCFPVPFALGVALPTLQWRRINRVLAALRPMMLLELRQYHMRAGRGDCKREPSRMEMHGTRRQNIEKLALRATETRYRTAQLPLGDEEDGPATPGSPHGNATMPLGSERVLESPFSNLSAFEAELVVRAELSQPGNTDTRKRRRRFGRSVGSVPSMQAVEHSMWLYAEAMNEFAEDAVDIARVKIEYARFLQVYTEDVNLATGALEGALRERPSAEGEYQVFTRTRRLQSKRQSQNADADASMNQLALMEYSKRLRSALHSHSRALSDIQKLLASINRHRASLGERADSMADRLGAYVARLATHTADANQKYRRLLITHPTAPGLYTIYSRFCRDVLKSSANLSTDGRSDAASDYGSVTSGGSGFTGATGATSGTGATAKIQAQSLRPVQASKQVVRIDMRFRVATFFLVLIAVGMTITTSVFLDRADANVEAVHTVGDLRFHAVDVLYRTRQASLLSTNNSYDSLSSLRNSTYGEVATWKFKLMDVYEHFANEVVDTLWHAPVVAAKTYSTNDSWYEANTNLWNTMNVVAADAADYADHPDTDFHNNKHWRFVVDNTLPRAMPRLQLLVQAFVDEGEADVLDFGIVQGAMLGVLVLLLAYVGFCIFGGALKRVRVIKLGVVDIAANLPPLTLARMRRDAVRGIAFVRRARVKALAAVNDTGDEELDRGVGPVHNFTYDADVDGSKPVEPVSGYAAGGGAGTPTAAVARRSPSSPTRSLPSPVGRSSSGGGSRASGRKSTPPMPVLAEAPDSCSDEESSNEEETKAAPGVRFNDAVQVAVEPSHGTSTWVALEGSRDPEPQPGSAHSEFLFAADDSERSGSILAPRRTASARSLPPIAPTHSPQTAGPVAATTVTVSPTPASAPATPAAAATLDASPQTAPPMPPMHPAVPAGVTASSCPVVGHTFVGTHSLRQRRGSATQRAQHGDSDVQAAKPVDAPSIAAVAAATRTSRRLSTSLLPTVEQVLQENPGSVMCTDAIGTILYANNAALAATGYTREELLGRNVTLLQPEELAARHHLLMKRVVDGGTPQVIGKAGRQLALIQKNGQARPVLLALNRLVVGDTLYFVADLADISDASADNAEDAEDEEDTKHSSRARQLALLRVLLALFFVALLQAGAFVFSLMSLTTIVNHASEVAHANNLRSIARTMAFTCREAAIGDNELWSPTAATQRLSEDLASFTHTRFAIRFGDASMGLTGSVGTSAAQDELQFGTVATDGTVFQGLDALVAFYERHVDLCVRQFADGSLSLGPDIQLLEADPVWKQVEATAFGDMPDMLSRSEALFRDLTRQETARAAIVDKLIACFNAVAVVCLYLFVFRTMVRELLGQAQWTEQLLVIVPRELGLSGPLQKYFERVEFDAAM